MLKAWLGLSLASNFAPSPSSLLRAQQRLGDALDRAADAALAPATNMLQPDAPQQQRSIFAEAAHSEEEERAQLPTSLVPSWRAGRQSGTGSGRHVKYRRDMLTRKAIPARRSVAERLEAQMNATLRPATRAAAAAATQTRVRDQPTQVSGGERAAQFTRKYESVFWASLAPQIEFETDESSPGRATGDVRTSSDNRPRRFSGFVR
jgi:hypothetical protein